MVLAARVMAALAAVTLAGAAMGPTGMPAQVEGHRCTCSDHHGEGHECECPICRTAALVRRASDEGLPPCHRAAAERELIQTRSQGAGDAPSIACVCGEPPEPVSTPAGVGPCFIPVDGAVATTSRPTPRRSGADDPATAGRLEPETPPPRSA